MFKDVYMIYILWICICTWIQKMQKQTIVITFNSPMTMAMIINTFHDIIIITIVIVLHNTVHNQMYEFLN